MKVTLSIIKADIGKRLTPHGLRHTFASLLLEKGVAVPEVSALLGHKDSYVTWKVYAHFTRRESTAVQNLATSILGGELNVSKMSPLPGETQTHLH